MDEGPQLLVAGAGPAGLAAASALVSRGLRVRVVEASPSVGGKAHGRYSDGRSEEHGVHAWWPSYRNFDRLLREAGVDPEEALRPSVGGALLRSPGRLESLPVPRLKLPSPLFLFAYLQRFSAIGPGEVLQTLPFAVHALAFRHETDYASYDRGSFSDFSARVGVPSDIEKFLLRPFVLGFDYAPPDAVSAASVLSALQFYMLPSQDSIVGRWIRGRPQDKIFGPIATSIGDRGGTLERSVSLGSVVIEDGAVTGARLVGAPTSAGEGGTGGVAKIPAADVPDEAFRSFQSATGPILVGRIGGVVQAFSATCPHQGGTVEWQKGGFACSKHPGVFQPDGRATGGPPSRMKPPGRLTSLPVRASGDIVEVLGAERVVACRHVIVATDLPGARDILGRSPGVPVSLVERLGRLGTTPVIVVRLWFQTGTDIPGFETVILPDGALAHILFHLNALDAVYDDEGVVVEVHASDPAGKWSRASEDEILDAVFRDLSTLGWGLTRDHLRPGHAWDIEHHRDSFTRYGPGELANRPSEDGGVAGLHLAGDWTRASWSVWMMERAVVSGLRAANRVLRSHGLPPVEIERLPPEGWLLTMSRWLARSVRGLGWV